MTHVINSGDFYPIQPKDIDQTRVMWDQACWVVRFCRDRESWDPFTSEEINAFYQTHGGETERFFFQDLVDEGFIHGPMTSVEAFIPGSTMEEIEKAAILLTLQRFGRSPSKAAKALGISVRKIHSRLKDWRMRACDMPALDPESIVRWKGRYFITEEFVKRCTEQVPFVTVQPQHL